MNTDLQKLLEATEATRMERCLEALAGVPELPGEMPDEMWAMIAGDRDAMTEALRIAVRKTKDAAANAIIARTQHSSVPPAHIERIRAYFAQRIEDGAMLVDDIPTLIARYGCMEPGSFLAEMHERIEQSENEE